MARQSDPGVSRELSQCDGPAGRVSQRRGREGGGGAHQHICCQAISQIRANYWSNLPQIDGLELRA